MEEELTLVTDDPWLAPYRNAIASRRDRFLQSSGNSPLKAQATLHRTNGLLFDTANQQWTYREYAPHAHQLSLVGDFNHWDNNAHPATRDEQGNWNLTLPADTLSHLSNYKVCVVGDNGTHHRLSPFTRYAVQNPEDHSYTSTVWQPERPYQWKNGPPQKPRAPRIYEAHLGIATEREGVGTYDEFRTFVLPRIAQLGYDTVQMMAIAEHPYYGSFGYHVANFFAPSSRFGTPDELRALIDDAHGLGLSVILDLVHSHTIKNFAEGIREFDGKEGYLLHSGPAGQHEQWDSLLFDYGHPATRGFLLSNLAYWLEDFHFDGFRFDGVTSMLYQHHGDTTFDHYDKYFHDGVDSDSVTYLQLANTLIREITPSALTIAEDFSGMPGCCQPPTDGGLGFDYRLGMGIPDHWIKLLKHTPDEQWDLNTLWNQLSNRRYGEKTVAYAESHDQGLVGDKTLAFWLMDKEMYTHMKKSDESPIIDRGIAFHKMIRLLTMIAGGEAWLNFIGNEFGHPEWIDFPREGNDWSYKYARRQWHLADNPDLKYSGLQNFEKALLALVRDHKVLEAPPAQLLNIDQGNLSIQFERANLIFALNFHPNNSISDYQFPTHIPGTFQHILDTDQAEFDGLQRLTPGTLHHALDSRLKAYLPNRCALIFQKTD